MEFGLKYTRPHLQSYWQ